MMNTKIKKIINPDNDTLRKTTNWMYNWWGIEEKYTYEEVECYMKNSFNDKKLPQTYGIFLNDELIGIYQLTYRDLFSRPDIYPWLANLYVAKEYRNKGYGKMLIHSIKHMVKENNDFNEIFLYTKYEGLYEKYEWKFIEYINTFNLEQQKERLYKLVLN